MDRIVVADPTFPDFCCLTHFADPPKWTHRRGNFRNFRKRSANCEARQARRISDISDIPASQLPISLVAPPAGRARSGISSHHYSGRNWKPRAGIAGSAVRIIWSSAIRHRWVRSTATRCGRARLEANGAGALCHAPFRAVRTKRNQPGITGIVSQGARQVVPSSPTL